MDTDGNGRVVVGVDRTLPGLEALRRAVTEARARGASLNVVRVWRSDPYALYPRLQDQPEAAAAAALIDAAFADTMGAPPIDLELRTVLIPGSPGPALVRYASRDGDLLVLGAARRSYWSRWRSRSVTRYCLARAACPVLVIPPPALVRATSAQALLRELRRDFNELEGIGVTEASSLDHYRGHRDRST